MIRSLLYPIRGLRAVFRQGMAWLTSPRGVWLGCEPLFRMAGRAGASPPRRILVVRLDAMGDVVLTVPLVRELRRSFPKAWITWAVSPRVRNLVESCPYIDELATVDTYSWYERAELPWVRNWKLHREALRVARRFLWPCRFDLAIVPRWDADYYHAVFVAYFSGAARRIGYSERVLPHKRELNRDYDVLLTHRLTEGSPKHEVEHNLDLLPVLGGKVADDRLELWPREEDERFADSLLGTSDRVVALAPGASAPKRAWPLDSYLRTGGGLIRDKRTRLLLLGGVSDRDLGESLRRQLGASVVQAAGSTTLRQAAALLKRCSLYVGNDTGLMHVAAAVGKPVVEISCHPSSSSPFNSNAPQRFGPWKVPHRVLQPSEPLPPCSEYCQAREPHCITQVTVERVLKACEDLLRNRE